MAYLELNALSTILGGAFTARVFLPGLDRLDLVDARHQKRYPVLWLLHTDGETSLEFLKTPAESLAEQYGFIAIAPDLHHSMGTDMKWGPNVEKFLTREIRGIFKHLLPVSDLREENFIGGVGTGAYAALKCACKHPDLFSKAFSLNGILDMERLIAKTAVGEATGVPQTAEALDAVFGGAAGFLGGPDDLFALAKQPQRSEFYLCAEKDFGYYTDSRELAALLGEKASFVSLDAGADYESCQVSMRGAAAWLFQ